jgi:RNA polymerase sigma-70 factor, ECF subfamily
MKKEEVRKKELISELIEQNGQSIYRLVYTFVRDRHVTEDLTQDIFVKCYQKLDQFSNQSSYSTWIYRIAVNHCKDYLRSNSLRRAKHAFLSKMAVQSEPTPEELVINKSSQSEIINLVLCLPEKYRGPIYLHYIEDKPISEVMEILDLSKNTVYTRLRRGLEKIKKTSEMEGLKLNGYQQGMEGNH